MADIRILSGTAWLGFAGFGIQLKIIGQAPNSGPATLGYSSTDQPGNGVLGNGAILGTPWYWQTIGIGNYKIWAEHPDSSNVTSNEVNYYFDPDHYQGSGDPFDWNGNGVIQSVLLVPAKKFSVYGSIQSSIQTDWATSWWPQRAVVMCRKQISRRAIIPQIAWTWVVKSASTVGSRSEAILEQAPFMSMRETIRVRQAAHSQML